MVKEILSVSGLTIQVHGKALMRDVSFSVGEGEAILLSGANGVGKSTLLKALLRLETEGKQIDGRVTSNHFGDVLALSPEELQRYRASVAYVQQKDEYAQIGNVRVRDLFSDSALAFSGKALSDAEVNELIDEWIPRRRDNSRVFSARSVPAHFSGGEQRLLSVLSTLATRPNAELLIIEVMTLRPLGNGFLSCYPVNKSPFAGRHHPACCIHGAAFFFAAYTNKNIDQHAVADTAQKRKQFRIQREFSKVPHQNSAPRGQVLYRLSDGLRS